MSPITIPGGGGTAQKYYTPVMIEGSDTLLYTDTTAKTIATIPANSMIIEIRYRVVTAFDDSGTNTFDTGITGEEDAFADGRSLEGTSALYPTFSFWSGDTSFRENAIRASETSILAKYIGSNTDSTQGELKFYITYVLLS